MKALPKHYNASEAEARWQAAWEEKKIHAWDASASREESFVIDTPPPTVSGHLHMGHIFSYTQADFVARYQRMAGKSVFYPMGFDDNGLPTERLVEKVIKKRATDLTREQFIAECEKVTAEARDAFRQLFQSVALSVDWAQEYHTISDSSRRISQESFLDLYNKGHAYRELRPFFWDPVDQTAIAQAEIEDKELSSHFHDIAFGIDGSAEKLVIGTTRPELIPACVGIFFHPEDARYQHLKGKQAVTPLFGVKVPILEDDTVEPEKGTGIMMCCTFGDEKDIEKWRKHKLATRVILNKYGKLDGALLQQAVGENATAQVLVNLKVSNIDPKHPGAREKIVELLRESGNLLSSKPIVHAVKCAERSGAPLEILPTPQWFVRVMDKKDALKARAAECAWHPEFMKHRMDQWIDGLASDWCISRQRYFGVPFPVWFSKRAGEEGKILVADTAQLPVNPLTDLPKGYSREEVTPDADVMDTWATSSCSPQISAHGLTAESCEDKNRFGKLFPASLRPQAHEIIRTWAFYTLVKAHLHNHTIPWTDLMISGWCLAPDKTKMSKSKGNVITPVELIRDKSADAVRYWASTSRLGADTAFSEDVLKIGKKLVTKLWNATQFAAIHLNKLERSHGTAKADVDAGIITEALDKWILTRLHRAVAKATAEFERFEYADARAATEDFFWNDFCDNYLELVKARVYGENGSSAAAQQSAVHTIHHCLNGILKLFAPFVPHITEELFAHVFDEEFADKASLHVRGSWPKAADFPLDATAEQSGIAGVQILNAVRKAKSEKSLSIKFPIELLRIGAAGELAALVTPVIDDVKAACNAAAVEWGPGGDIATEDCRFTLSVQFATESDVA